MEKHSIALHCGHNAGIALAEDGVVIDVFEFERYWGQKNTAINHVDRDDVAATVKHAKKMWGDVVIGDMMISWEDEGKDLVKIVSDIMRGSGASAVIECMHHHSHASGSFYQSDFDKALIVSVDGGGNDGVFNVYTGDRDMGVVRIARHHNVNLGWAYSVWGNMCASIKKENDAAVGNLVYPGKLMALAGYGTPDADFVNAIKHYTLSNKKSPPDIVCGLRRDKRYSGDIETMIAASSQKAFEDLLIMFMTPYVTQYKDYPIIITGGCGLNIIGNTKVEQCFNREVFVAPNSSDCGLPVGMIAGRYKKQQEITYSGLPIIGRSNGEWRNAAKTEASVEKIGAQLINGKVIGVMRGRSEHGPRALGNRSILSIATSRFAKDNVNSKIKNREWYRPFAPVVRLEDVGKFFTRTKESRWMNFVSGVRSEWQDRLPAITHIDGTARVQTVTRTQNAFLYDILTYIDKHTGIGVLVNTSLNVDGQPIAASIHQALQIFNTTDIDGIVIDNEMLMKPL